MADTQVSKASIIIERFYYSQSGGIGRHAGLKNLWLQKP